MTMEFESNYSRGCALAGHPALVAWDVLRSAPREEARSEGIGHGLQHDL